MRKTLFLLAKSYRLYFTFIGWFLLSVLNYGQKASVIDNKSDNYLQIFGNKYVEACAFIAANAWISDTLKAYKVDPAFATAIIFPELIRYSALRDKFEVGGLITLYVQYGQKYADFSVGHFQMKPTFAKQLENDLQKLTTSTPWNNYKFDLNETEKARLERVKRLDSPIWQVGYLALFIKIMDVKYSSKVWRSQAEKLQFYATAYNNGYTLPESIINGRIALKTFYTSILKGKDCYCYASIALDFFKSVSGKL